jgi:hypothetical protein
MTDIADLVEPLKLELAVPGTFAAVYPSTGDEDLRLLLLNAVGQTQLVGFLPTSVLDVDLGTVEPDLSPAAKALVTLYAADKILSLRILELNTRAAYQAGPVKYETEKSASVLAEFLKQLRERRREIIDMATSVGRSRGGFAMGDRYAANSGSIAVLVEGRTYDFFMDEIGSL